MADLTESILLEIRDDLREMKAEQRKTNERLDQTNQRLDQTIERLDETNQRLGALAHITRGIDTRLQRIEDREPDRLFLPQRVDALEARVTRLEAVSPED